MKIFGIELFGKSNQGEMLYGNARNQIRESKNLPDFHRGTRMFGFNSTDPMEMPIAYAVDATTAISMGKQAAKDLKKKMKAKTEEKISLTPKGVYEAKLLHEMAFKINTDPAYIDEQLNSFKERLNIIKVSDFDMENGSLEIQSMIIRLENRKKYPEFKSFFDQYPYAKSEKIQKVLEVNTHLRMGMVDQFVPDLPKEAIDAIQAYKKTTEKMCKKFPLFYIIADKKDFQKTVKRRDPILLAQSPFGHFWQILGAWDKEMLLLSDL